MKTKVKSKAKEAKKQKPVWQKRSENEIQELVVKLAKQGMKPSMIGLTLRDSYGVSATPTKITKILAKHDLAKEPEDLAVLIAAATRLRKHLAKNKKDLTAKRGLQVTEAKIIKLATYYKKRGMLPKSWKYR